MRKFLMSFLILVMVGLAGCFGSDVGNEKGDSDVGAYSSQLNKIMQDAKMYANSSKRAGTRYVLDEGLYIIMDEAGQKVLYSYSVDDLAKMNALEVEDLLFKLAIAGPRGDVYVVFGDNSIGLFEYVSIEDTRNNGIAPSLDPTMLVSNKGTTVGDVTAKAIVDEIPLDMVSTTGFTMVLKYPFEDLDGTGILGDRVDLVLANSEPKVVHTGYVSEISEDGYVAKVSMSKELVAGKVYLPRSSSESRIYFGSNAVIVPGESDELYVYSSVEVANGEFTVRMNRAETTIKATDFTVIEILGNKANYAEDIKIKSMDGAFVTFTVKPVAQIATEQVLSYKVAYKNTPQVSTGKVVIPPTGVNKAIVNVKAENGKVYVEMNATPTTTDVASIVLVEYVDGTNTKTISLSTGITEKNIEQVMIEFQDLISLNSTIGDSIFLEDALSEENEDSLENEILDQIVKEDILETLTVLKEREKDILVLRFGLDGNEPKTLEEVGKIFNITRERVRQIEKKALEKLKKEYNDKLRAYLEE